MTNSQENTKKDLVHYLQNAVRALQKEYVKNRDVIPSSELTNSLCYGLEAVFLHGLIAAVPGKTSSLNFWAVLSKHTHKSTLSDVDSSSQIKTDVGRCRAWIRLALNGCELESYLRLILADLNTLRLYYEPWSFIRDVEHTDLLLTYLQGLECIRFHLGHNSTILNDWGNVSLFISGVLPSSSSSHPPVLMMCRSNANSFDDYELSPDDREEVRLMFRFESDLMSSDDSVTQTSGTSQVQALQPNTEATTSSRTLSDSDNTAFFDESVLQNNLDGLKRSQGFGTKTLFSTGLSFNSLGCGNSEHETNCHSNGTEMTDEMRNLRFDRIVRDNLDKYPLDYDRFQLKRQKESLHFKELGKKNEMKMNGENKKCSRFCEEHNSVDQGSSCETSVIPDAFWRTLQDDPWSEMEAEPAGGTPIQSNSLPQDSWVGPPSMSEFSPVTGFPADRNDRVRHELEASYGTILANYQITLPQQLKMVTLLDDVKGLDESVSQNTRIGCDFESVTKPSQNQKSNGQKIEDEWIVIEDECPFMAEPFHVDSSYEMQLAFATQRLVPKTLDDQNHQCRGCSKMIESRGRQCSFDGYWYCSHCHQNDSVLVPSQVIYNWDFRKCRVSKENFKFLKKIYDLPLINVLDLNPQLYEMSAELSCIRDLRCQSYYLAGYMFHCTSVYAEKYWRVMNARLYYFSHIDNYSLQDLVNVQSGSFQKALKKINDSAVKHVHSCGGCQSRGFYCEICQNSEIIFPFEVKKTSVCKQCKNTYHRQCKLSQEIDCPKCNRIQKRETTVVNDPIDLVMFTHPADVAAV